MNVSLKCPCCHKKWNIEYDSKEIKLRRGFCRCQIESETLAFLVRRAIREHREALSV